MSDSGPFAFANSDAPFAQMDGPFELVGGSERGYSLPPGDSFLDSYVVMIRDAAAPIGVRSIWMTGYVDARCSADEDGMDEGGTKCAARVGKVSFLGGHQYTTKLPMSTNASTQGTRLFLNSLFEASCTTEEGQPSLTLSVLGPTDTTMATVTYYVEYRNDGAGTADDVTLGYALPAGAQLESCSDGCTVAGAQLTWALGDLPREAQGTRVVTLRFLQPGVYSSRGQADFTVGLNRKTAISPVLTTAYAVAAPDAAMADAPVKTDAPDSGSGDAGPMDAAMDASDPDAGPDASATAGAGGAGGTSGAGGGTGGTGEAGGAAGVAGGSGAAGGPGGGAGTTGGGAGGTGGAPDSSLDAGTPDMTVGGPSTAPPDGGTSSSDPNQGRADAPAAPGGSSSPVPDGGRAGLDGGGVGTGSSVASDRGGCSCSVGEHKQPSSAAGPIVLLLLGLWIRRMRRELP